MNSFTTNSRYCTEKRERLLYQDYRQLLRELGFKNHKGESSLFKTGCAGMFCLYILDNIGIELRRKGVELPKWWNDKIQNQNVI